jgi:hypothetical protein
MSEQTERLSIVEEVFRLPPASAGDPFNFINEALIFLTRWCNAYPGVLAHGSPAYACFVGCERIGSDINSVDNCEEQKLFREDTPPDFLGKVYFCAYPLTRVFAKVTRLTSLHDCENALVSAGLLDRPVVFYNAAERRILWRLNAAGDLRQGIIRPAANSRLTTAQFDEVLIEFHRNYTETPQGYTKPWYSAPKFLTKADLEEEIRDDLFLFFRHMSPEPMSVLREFYNPAGRTDLLVVFREESQVYYVELKVLRGWQKNGENRSRTDPQVQFDWAKKGIAQAHAYRRLNNYPGAGYACCFDARELDSELPGLEEFAQEKDVRYRRYFMYASAETLQRSLMK